MSGAVETEAPRPRPLSGGLWTLFSWLRRDEHSSSDSLSSVGSDRTVASFAFLAPALYGGAAPASRPPPPPPTDSYKKRVRDRNLRRQHDRDITLHRKYGLYGFGYDALSLTSGRRAAAQEDRCERDRRAASESPRAHVPGKRRAPPPPSAPASLTRRRARKRPAPLPPITPIKETIESDVANIGNTEPMHRRPPDETPTHNRDSALGCKPEKYSKKDAQNKETKDVKIRHEKSFLKQIFENRKRNSAIETTSVKLLPNISELDKQAAEMIEKYRLKELAQSDTLDKELGKNESPGSSKQQTEAWICTRCLRKYNSSVITCNYCLPLNKLTDSYRSSKASNNFTQTKTDIKNAASGSGRVENKEKLKEMLKEMKDSLPKRPKNDLSTANTPKSTSEVEAKEVYPKIVEAPTLRIGSSICIQKNPIAQTPSENRIDESSSSQLVSHDINKANKKELTTINSVTITQPVVLVHTKQSNVVLNTSYASKEDSDKLLPIKNDSAKTSIDSVKNISQIERTKTTKSPYPLNISSKTKHDLNTPLKISSLLNPIYVPKNTSATNTQTPKLVKETFLEDAKTQNPTTSEIPEKAAKAASNVNSAAPAILQIQSKTSNLPLVRDDKEIFDLKKKLENEKESASNKKNTQVKVEKKEIQNTEVKTNNNLLTGSPLSIDMPSTSIEGRVDQHTRRRDLINQLEQSIAKGDEHAAAEAAVKLAQLRLSCSVLSFSSQIVAEATSSTQQQINVSKSTNEAKGKKVEEVIQKSTQTKIDPVKSVPTKQPAEKILMRLDDKAVEKEIPILTKEENVNVNNLILPKLESTNNIKSNCEKKDAVTQKPVLSEPSTSKELTKKETENEDVPILVWVEDKEATRGPVQLHMRRNAVMGDLRVQAEKSLGLAVRMQRWIVGRTLCSDDNTPLVTLAGPELSAPFYLCLVESDTKDTAKPQVEQKIKEDIGNVYNELMKLEKQALVLNAEGFECGVCIEQCAPGGGVVLRECVHSFCKDCLSDVVRHSEEPVVSCPAIGCRGVLQEREIRGLVSPDDYEKWLARGLAAAESGTRNAFHCRTRDCTGWALCDPGVRRFPCPVCKRTNCVPCQAIHEGETCDQHRAKVQESAASPDGSQTDEGTQALLKTLITRGEALECPECSAIITKKWGCDWVKCSACKTEICWVTKGRRWGPAGRGDTSGGCRCGIDGKRCHPSCGYCH